MTQTQCKLGLAQSITGSWKLPQNNTQQNSDQKSADVIGGPHQQAQLPIQNIYAEKGGKFYQKEYEKHGNMQPNYFFVRDKWRVVFEIHPHTPKSGYKDNSVSQGKDQRADKKYQDKIPRIPAFSLVDEHHAYGHGEYGQMHGDVNCEV